MKTLLFILLLSLTIYSQSDSLDNSVIQEVLQADIMPEPIGGLDSIHSKIVYPADALQNKIEGKVLVSCNLDTSGIVLDATVIRGIGYGCDEEALRVIRSANFSPALLNNKKVKCTLVVPIHFKIK